jgi:site-specific recombinase XerD
MGKTGRVRVTGPLAPYAASFEKNLVDRGYKARQDQLYLMAQLSRWLGDRGLDGCDLGPELAGAFVAERRLSAPSKHISVRRLAALVDHLVGSGVIATWGRAPDSSPTEVLLTRYSRYLVEERGLCRASVRHYVGVARSFLASLPGGGPGLEGLGAAEVSAFVLAECRRCKTGSAKAMTTRLRSLLRYLFVEGLAPAALAGAVPSVAHWRLSSLPRALGPGQVARLLASCDRRSSTGRRDFAVITLLWRLGLRCSEVAGLALDDVDWAAGELVVRGKGGRQDRLPLPVDVGEAVVAWLQRGRPRSGHRAVFLRVRAPLGPLSPGGVPAIVQHACVRAGVPVAAAHRLRHSAACDLLQAGGSLAEVGQVLRHGQSAATSTYAKVDRRALAAVVRPWPGQAR